MVGFFTLDDIDTVEGPRNQFDKLLVQQLYSTSYC